MTVNSDARRQARNRLQNGILVLGHGLAGNEDLRHIVVALLKLYQVVNWVGVLMEGNA